MRLTGFKKILMILLLVLTTGVGWWAINSDNPFFKVQELEVLVNFENHQKSFLVGLKPEIEKRIQPVKGQNIWSLSLAGIRDGLLNLPWVDAVELSRQFPNQIKSVIHIKPVVLLYLDNNNQAHPILKSGEKLKPIRATAVPDAPFLRNNNILKDKKQLKKVIALYQSIPAVGIFRPENIESIDWAPVTGLSLQLQGEKVLVHLGSKNIQTKVLQVLRVSDYLQKQKHKARVIDASFSKKVLVRLRKRS